LKKKVNFDNKVKADSNSNVADTDDNVNYDYNVQNDLKVEPKNQEKLRPHPGSESPSSHLRSDKTIKRNIC
jgi:hypothetical protein